MVFVNRRKNIFGPNANIKKETQNEPKIRLKQNSKQAMAEQGHTRSLSSKLNLIMNWDCQLGPSVAKLGLNNNRVDIQTWFCVAHIVLELLRPK